MHEPISPDTQPITGAMVQGEAWKFYFAPAAWLLYLILLPAIAWRGGAGAHIAALPFGGYLFAWMGYLMHECWHRYVHAVPSKVFCSLFALMIVTDPQIYRMLHGYHHTRVNTWEDTEFHPFGPIQNRFLRIVNNALEISVGAAYLVLASLVAVPRHPQFRPKFRWLNAAAAVLVWAGYLGGIGAVSHLAFGVPVRAVVLCDSVVLWLGSLLVHHSQLVEHGNLIGVGSWQERNLLTRNLSARGLAARLFLLMTHGDSAEHVLHHTVPGIYSRPFPGRLALPESAVMITLADYGRIIVDMLAGRPSAR
jgi:fatty acid desaturase